MFRISRSAAAPAALTLFGAAGVARAALLTDVTTPGDQIYGVQVTGGTTGGSPSASVVASPGGAGGSNGYPANEAPANAIDNTTANKYLNFGSTSTNNTAGNYAGFIVTPSAGPTNLTGIQFTTGNDSADRDPLTVTIEGTNTAIPSGVAAGGTVTATWSPIYSGPSGIVAGSTDPGRNLAEPFVNFTPTTAGNFTSYRVLVTSVRGDPSETCCMQFDEVQLSGNTPEPTSLGLLGFGGLGLLARRRRV